MDLKILSDVQNPLLSRRELKVEIPHTNAATPLRKDIITKVAALQGVPEDKVIVDKIMTQTGVAICTAKVFIFTAEPPVRQKAAQDKRMNKKAAKPAAAEEKKA